MYSSHNYITVLLSNAPSSGIKQNSLYGRFYCGYIDIFGGQVRVSTALKIYFSRINKTLACQLFGSNESNYIQHFIMKKCYFFYVKSNAKACGNTISSL